MSLVCRICFSTGNHQVYRVREMMFGLGEEFDYFTCAECGCLQIARVPEDLARYYPANYYSFHTQLAAQQGLKAWLAGKRDFAAATGSGILGQLLNNFVAASPDILSLGGIPASKEMRILDVGCGCGGLLSRLYRAGVGQLEGVDPYIAADLEVLPGLRVRKQALEQVSGKFDLIMLHHVFEHIEFGRELLEAGRRCLTPQGKILARLPTPESSAWEQYRENWVGVDAPRHLFLHTRKSLGILAAQSGLRIERCWSDSSSLHYWVSELYRRGLSLYEPNGCARNPAKHFSKAQMRQFDRLAEMENEINRGAQIALVLTALDSNSVCE